MGTELLVTRSAEETLKVLRALPEEERVALGERAQKRALAEHTAAHRAEELGGYALELLAQRQAARPKCTASVR